jgi:hypothetical protein
MWLATLFSDKGGNMINPNIQHFVGSALGDPRYVDS